MSDPLLRSKFYRPPLRPESIPRPRLIERLNKGLGRRLTLVSAPAGFGKTTLIVEWLQSLSRPSAWLSLDADDSDPAQFLSYLMAALEGLYPGADTLHRSPQPLAIKPALALLLNHLAASSDDTVLVLDDYHTIDAACPASAAIHEALAFFVEHLPPPPSGQLHLVLSSRVDPPLPLARWRTRGQLTEIRAPDLRFMPQEAASFLNQRMGLALSPEDVRALETRTEGWISGLHLAALSLRNQAPDRRSQFVAAFSGSHRHVIDYLAEEVLAQQPPEIHDFLCQTAILDRLTAPLCKAVTGRQDSGALLRRLEQENLFLVPLDDERRWYRYHHLFGEFVRSHAAQRIADQLQELHCRAAGWYERAGLLALAIGQALAAGAFKWAARLIEQAALQALMRGQVATVSGWLDALPDTVVRARPRLSIARAAALTIAGESHEIETYLQDAERGLLALSSPEDQQVLTSQVTVIRAYQATLEGRLDAGIALLQQANQQLAPDDLFFQGIVSWLRGLTLYFSHGSAAAGRAFSETVRLGQETGSSLMVLLSIFAAGYMDVVQGRLQQARARFEDGLRLAEAENQPPTSDRAQPLQRDRPPPIGTSLIYQGLGEIAREQNDLQTAEQHLARCIELVERWGHAEPLADSYVFCARVKHARGDVQGAHRLMEQAEQLGREGQVTALTVRQVEAYRARLWIVEGNLHAVAQWAAATERRLESESEQDEHFVLFVRGLEERTLAWLYVAQGRYPQAIRLLAPYQQKLQAVGWTGIEIEVLALQALALDGQGHTGQALEALQRALSVAEPEGYARTFVDLGPPMAALLEKARPSADGGEQRYTDRLLAMFRTRASVLQSRADGSAVQEPPLAEPLTGRERQVLRLVVAGLSNREIAEELVITLGTAKRHVSNIYAKLGVHSRVRAVAKARELRLV